MLRGGRAAGLQGCVEEQGELQALLPPPREHHARPGGARLPSLCKLHLGMFLQT